MTNATMWMPKRKYARYHQTRRSFFASSASAGLVFVGEAFQGVGGVRGVRGAAWVVAGEAHGQDSLWTLLLEAWARGRTTRRSMLTCGAA